MAAAKAKSDFSEGAVEKLLQCAICLGRLNDPRVLSCQHYFCKECLEGCAGSGGVKGKSLKCAICRKITKLSVRGVTALPVNYAVAGLLEMAVRRKQDEGGCHLHNSSDSVAFTKEAGDNGKSKLMGPSPVPSHIDLDSATREGGRKSTKRKGIAAARVIAKTVTDEHRNVISTKNANLVMVYLSSSSETSSDSESSESASSSNDSESDSSETSDYSYESSCSSLSDDSQSTSSDNDGEPSDDSLPSSSISFGEMSIVSE